MEQFGGLCEFDQDVGLGRSAPACVSTFLGDGLIERRDAATGLLQLAPQRLEGGAIVLLQCREPIQRLRRESGAGIGRGLLGKICQRIANFLGRVDGGGDQVFGVMVLLSCSLSSRAILDARRGPAACR